MFGGLPLWFIWALLSAVFAGTSAVFAKVGLEEVDPDLATLVRTFVMSYIFCGIWFFRYLALF